MSAWKEMFESVNEEYLVGLTNKGIVKRAIKDMEQTVFQMKEEEKQLTVQVEDDTCTIVFPLGESKCSCPSRSICKHIIMAVLYARSRFLKDSQSNRQLSEKEKNGGTGTEEGNIEVIREQKEPEACKEFEESILSFPYAKLIKTIGEKKFQNLYDKIKQGIWPEIKETSIVTVFFPETRITVRLLEPVEYSSCTCHKKELCLHKSEAILYYQLYAGILTEEVLAAELEETNPADFIGAKEFAEHLKDFLSGQLITGLARSSPAVTDSYERMAILSHNQKLPDFERTLREIKEEFQQYFKRAAAFQVNTLMHQISSLYQKAEALSAIQTREEFKGYAGDFRTEYTCFHTLTLLGMGQREFHSKSGYEGETYYFLSEDTQEWYTYTNARPVFYETNKKRTTWDKAMAPWQLPCRLEELAEAKILLYNGKASRDHRLSATREAKAELLGKRRLEKIKLNKQYFEDFLLLFEERIADSWQQEGEKEWENNLVLIQPAYIKNPSFDTIKQEYTMELYDKANRLLLLRLTYSKTEHYTIKYLERLGKRIQQGDMAVPCFFGALYIEEGKMKLYPINYYDSSEIG